MRCFRITLAIGLAWYTMGCAGTVVSFEIANQSANIIKKSSGDAIDQGAGIDFDIGYNKLSIVDSSGGLLAAITNAGSKEVARREAMGKAAERGARPGETVQYEYTVQDAVPGIATKLSYVFGGSSTGSTYNDSLVGSSSINSKNEISGFIFEFGFGDFEMGPVNAEFGIRLDYLNYKISNLPSGAAFQTFEDTVIAMPFLINIGYTVHPLVRLSARAGYDPIFGLMNLVAESDSPATNTPLAVGVEVAPTVKGLLLTMLWRSDQVNLKTQAMDRSEMLMGASYSF